MILIIISLFIIGYLIKLSIPKIKKYNEKRLYKKLNNTTNSNTTTVTDNNKSKGTNKKNNRKKKIPKKNFINFKKAKKNFHNDKTITEDSSSVNLSTTSESNNNSIEYYKTQTADTNNVEEVKDKEIKIYDENPYPTVTDNLQKEDILNNSEKLFSRSSSQDMDSNIDFYETYTVQPETIPNIIKSNITDNFELAKSEEGSTININNEINNNADNNNDNDKMNALIDEINTIVESIVAKEDSLNNIIDEKNYQIEIKEKEIQKLNEKYQKMLDDSLTNTKTEEDTLTNKYQKVVEQNEQLNDAIKNLEFENINLLGKCNDIQQELDKKQIQYTELESAIEKLKTEEDSIRSNLMSEINGYKEEIKEKDEMIKEIEKQKDDILNQMEETEEKINPEKNSTN